MEHDHNTRPLEVFFAIGSLVLTFVVAFAVGGLLFNVINHYIADPLAANAAGRIDGASIRYTMAVLIITFPLLLLSRRYLKRTADSRGAQLASRFYDAATYAVLFIAGATIVGDLVAIVYGFLNGDATLRFMLKALVVLVLAGIVFQYYFIDRKRREFGNAEKTSQLKMLEGATAVLVLVSLVFGFVIAGGPGQARIERFDEARVADLQELEQAINWYADTFGEAPATIGDVVEAAQARAPRFAEIDTDDPVSNAPYTYELIATLHADQEIEYNLCATFSLEGQEVRYGARFANHPAGEYCETIVYHFFHDGVKPAPVR